MNKFNVTKTWLQWRSLMQALRWLGLVGLLVVLQQLLVPAAVAQTTVSLAQVPLLALKSAPGLVMMTMSRDHRLFEKNKFADGGSLCPLPMPDASSIPF